MSIVFNDISSDKIGVVVKLNSFAVVPERNRVTQSIIGSDGIIDYDIDSFGERNISFSFSFPYVAEEYAIKCSTISDWLIADGKYKKLYMSEFPDRYYLAKAVGASEAEIENGVVRIDCDFVCNPPFAYALNGTLLDHTWLNDRGGWSAQKWGNTAYQKEIDTSGSIAFNYRGKTIYPRIWLIGYINTLLTVSSGGDSIKVMTSPGYDGLLIDCSAETITRLSDGSSWLNNCTVSNGFFEITAGNNEFTLSGATKPVTMIVDFRGEMV